MTAYTRRDAVDRGRFLAAVKEGLSNQALAERFGVSVATIKGWAALARRGDET